MGRITQYRSHPELTEILVTRSFETIAWMREKGVRFAPMYGRQAFKIGEKFRFWGGLTVRPGAAAPGWSKAFMRWRRRTASRCITASRRLSFLYDGRTVSGVKVRDLEGNYLTVRARSVVLACGGFEANAEWRTRYLGPGWDIAKVRGTSYNTGDGIRMALAIGAMPYGNWSGCHAVGWDMNAPEFGDLTVGDNFQKHATRSASWSTLAANASLMRAPIFATTRMPYTGGAFSSSQGISAGRCSIRRSCTCCATNIASAASPACAPIP